MKDPRFHSVIRLTLFPFTFFIPHLCNIFLSVNQFCSVINVAISVLVEIDQFTLASSQFTLASSHIIQNEILR